MMRRRFVYSALCLLMAGSGLALSSCSKEEMAVDDVSRPSDYVSFSSALSPLSGSAATRSSANYLEISEEDWSLEGEVSSTKATPMAALADNLAVGIVGFNYTGAWSDSNTPWSDGGASLDNISYTYSSGTGVLAAASPIPWKNLTYTTSSDKLRIYAYAPYGDFSTAVSHTSGVPSITYTVDSDVANHKDLIVANNEVAADAKVTIPLDFTHALTAIQFKVGFACYVTSLQIKGVYGTGVYTMESGWSASTTKDFTALTYSGTVQYAADAMIADGANTFLMIPQTVPADATVELKFKATPEGDEKTLTAKIDGQTWLAGKRITYTIKETPTGYIYFDLALGNVTIMSDGEKYVYSGKAWDRTTAAAITITGNHVNGSNKYYVYQSTASNRSSTGWSNGEGSTMIVPSYAEPKTNSESLSALDITWGSSGSKTWSDFITNNPHNDAVIANWSRAAAAVNRTSTSNRIQICGNTTLKQLDVDITIDNLWSSYHTNSAARTDGAFMTGPGSSDKSSNRYERVTLKLKGDSRFYNVLNYSHPTSQTGSDRAYFHVTSADGNHSTKGSLTVAPPNNTDILANANSIFGGSDDGVQYGVYDMNFYGGTLYVSTNQLTAANHVSGVLGGGTNCPATMVFDGAVVTAVAYSTGAAIGGGGGFNANGGDGTITINSGKVYAYQFGFYSSAASGSTTGGALATTAIGGGSSYDDIGNTATVTINGGEVFAQSLGGAAIGGGTSQYRRGGQATITINGGTVTANSISGTIRDGYGNSSSVSASSSIGGGRGGKGAASVNADGGFANLTVAGGTLIAGSIGGGGTIGEANGSKIGSATIIISQGLGAPTFVQGQFIMAKGSAATAPSFTMSGGTIQNDLYTAEFVQNNGGAVYIDKGTCTISGGTIRNCSSTGKGGAVYMNRGTFTMSGSAVIENCSAESGGGAVYIDDGDFTMNGGTIRSCVSSTHGGGIYVDGGTVEVSAGSITGNIASGASANGGGVFINRGSFSMPYGSLATISNNHARGSGGGVYVTSAENVTASVISGSVIGNAADGNGGGLCVIPSGENTATVTIGDDRQGNDNPTITGNNAGLAGGGLYAQGSHANITINSGQIKSNDVTGYVYNPDVANELGTVTLNGGDVTHVTITFDPNGGTYTPGGTCQQKIVKATNSLLVLPLNEYFTHASYGDMSGWKDAEGNSYTNGQVMNINEDLTLYAQWN